MIYYYYYYLYYNYNYYHCYNIELSKDEELVKAISSFVVTLMSRPEINEVIKKLLMTSTQTG